MRLDTFNNPIFNETDLFNLLYQNKKIDISNIIVDASKDLQLFEETAEIVFQKPNLNLYNYDINAIDNALQSDWFMPDNYKTMDIEQYIIDLTPDNCTCLLRVREELTEYKKRNMLNLLRWLVYFVDNCTDHNVVWGVGRGSSVSSYVLYLLNVHSVDSIQYNLDWHDFLR